jgi:NADH dehydrogenase (ubiquinone) 1 alpha/beta subcomplex 1
MALAGVRSLILSHVRFAVGNPCIHTQQVFGGASSLTLLRQFAEGTYLDKDQVTERVLHVVKHFDKVEPSKVNLSANPRPVYDWGPC